MSLIEQKKTELNNVMSEQRRTIRNYCDAIGCKDCPLKEPNSCYSIQLQDREFNLEAEIDNLIKTSALTKTK